MSDKHTHLFVTGMFRSGTTLFARMFNTHPQLVLASDPFAPLFKSFRNEVAHEIFGSSFDGESPLGDYYFCSEQQKLFEKIRETSFDVPLTQVSHSDLISTVRRHAMPYSPKIAPFIEQLSGTTFRELIHQAMEIIQQAYGERDTHQIVGIKEVWSGEFSRQMLHALPDSRVIHLVRDPRAVVASNFSSTGPYPILFLARQWRKLASLAYLDAKFQSQCLLVRYEDLIRFPEQESRRICTFLGIDFDPVLLSPDGFKDGQNRAWSQNTSYQADGSGFNTKSLDKWKEVLKPGQVTMLEYLCRFEMQLLGYDVTSASNSLSAIELSKELDCGDIPFAQWIKPYASYNLEREALLETERVASIEQGLDIPADKKRALCLDSGLYDELSG